MEINMNDEDFMNELCGRNIWRNKCRRHYWRNGRRN